MTVGNLDLDTRFGVLIIYKRKSDNTINTLTTGIAFKAEYKAMMNDDDVEILGVYKQLTESQIRDIISQ